MKRLLSILASFAFIAAALSPVALISTAGCASAEKVTYKSIAGLQATVEASLSAWADYVVERRRIIAELPPEEQGSKSADLLKQEGKVRNALGNYQTAAAAVQVAIRAAKLTDSSPAPGPMLKAGTDFVATVSTLTK